MTPAKAMQSSDIGVFSFEWDNDRVYHYLFFYFVKADVGHWHWRVSKGLLHQLLIEFTL
jgi:hypothetical protein